MVRVLGMGSCVILTLSDNILVAILALRPVARIRGISPQTRGRCRNSSGSVTSVCTQRSRAGFRLARIAVTGQNVSDGKPAPANGDDRCRKEPHSAEPDQDQRAARGRVGDGERTDARQSPKTPGRGCAARQEAGLRAACGSFPTAAPGRPPGHGFLARALPLLVRASSRQLTNPYRRGDDYEMSAIESIANPLASAQSALRAGSARLALVLLLRP